MFLHCQEHCASYNGSFSLINVGTNSMLHFHKRSSMGCIFWPTLYLKSFYLSFELLGWTASMNSSNKLFWPCGLSRMESHRHQHLLETISKQPLRDTTLISCTIDDFASSIFFFSQPQACNSFPTRPCVLLVRTQNRLCPTRYPCVTAATLTTADIAVHTEQHTVGRCWLILVSLNITARPCPLPLSPLKSCLRLQKHMGAA